MYPKIEEAGVWWAPSGVVMDGWLKALVAAACVVVIAGGGWFAWGEYRKSQPVAAQQQQGNDVRDEMRVDNNDYIKCRNSLHSSALGEAKKLRDWCRQNDYITYTEQLRAEGVAN